MCISYIPGQLHSALKTGYVGFQAALVHMQACCRRGLCTATSTVWYGMMPWESERSGQPEQTCRHNHRW